jgi:hypothetical protein
MEHQETLYVSIVPMNANGELFFRQDENGYSLMGGYALPNETGEEAARRLAKAETVELIATEEENHTLMQLYLAETEQALPHTAGSLPEVFLSNEKMSADLRQDALFDKAVGELSRRSGEKRVPAGRYRHFKGREYQVLGIAVHSETLMPMVVYQAQYGHFGLWVRPIAMWNERVVRDGYDGKRFSKI